MTNLTDLCSPAHGELGIWSNVWEFLKKVAQYNDRIVDLGCGGWRWSLGMETTVYRIDKDPKTKPDLVWDLNRPLPIDVHSFDGALAMEIIEHLENPFQFLREVCRITKRWIIITSPDPDLPMGAQWLGEFHYLNYGHITRVPSYLIKFVCAGLDWKITDTKFSRTPANYIVLLEKEENKT